MVCSALEGRSYLPKNQGFIFFSCVSLVENMKAIAYSPKNSLLSISMLTTHGVSTMLECWHIAYSKPWKSKMYNLLSCWLKGKGKKAWGEDDRALLWSFYWWWKPFLYFQSGCKTLRRQASIEVRYIKVVLLAVVASSIIQSASTKSSITQINSFDTSNILKVNVGKLIHYYHAYLHFC